MEIKLNDLKRVKTSSIEAAIAKTVTEITGQTCKCHINGIGYGEPLVEWVGSEIVKGTKL